MIDRETVEGCVYETAVRGSDVFTDAHRTYNGLWRGFSHQTVDHAESYVHGLVHTNRIENFWALPKRGLHGTYISVQPYHLFRYLDERAFTFNDRDLTDFDASRPSSAPSSGVV
jgi:ISXO2-like transposase domain